jgi:hypothetical protein
MKTQAILTLKTLIKELKNIIDISDKERNTYIKNRIEKLEKLLEESSDAGQFRISDVYKNGSMFSKMTVFEKLLTGIENDSDYLNFYRQWFTAYSIDFYLDDIVLNEKSAKDLAAGIEFEEKNDMKFQLERCFKEIQENKYNNYEKILPEKFDINKISQLSEDQIKKLIKTFVKFSPKLEKAVEKFNYDNLLWEKVK